MKRREFITFVGATATWWPLRPLTARAQRPRPRPAVLSLNSVRDEGKIIAALLDGLRALGYFSGRTIDVDYRYADGYHTRLAHLAQELIGFKPSVAVATS